MKHDIVVKVNLNAEEYVGLSSIADDTGLSMSAIVRQLIKREIAAHATRILALYSDESTKAGQD